MQDPVHSILAYFTKLCLDKNEFPCFNRRGLVGFCYDAKENYPKIFDTTAFFKDLTTYSDDIDDELFRLTLSRLLYSYGADFHPHQTSKNLIVLCRRTPLEYDKSLSELSQKLYDELGCDKSGVAKKHSKFSSIEQLD